MCLNLNFSDKFRFRFRHLNLNFSDKFRFRFRCLNLNFSDRFRFRFRQVKKIWRESIFQKTIEEKSLPKNIQTNSLPKNLERNIPSQEVGQRNLYPKNVWAHFKQNIFDDDMYLAKNSLKRYPCQTNFNRNLYQKGRHMFIPRNSLKRSLYKAIFEINHHQKMKKSATGTWRNISTKKMKATFYLNISEKKLSTEQSVQGSSQPNKLCIKVSSKQIPKEASTKEYLRKHAYQT